MTAFCTKCGLPLVELTQPTGKFSSWNGKPTFSRWLICPSWRTLPWSRDNGHRWLYYGSHSRGTTVIAGSTTAATTLRAILPIPVFMRIRRGHRRGQHDR